MLVPGSRWSKVSPDHILNESALRSEGPLSTVVLLALSKRKESKEGGRREKEKERTRGAGKVAVMYLALSCPMPRHGRLGPTLRFVTASRVAVYAVFKILSVSNCHHRVYVKKKEIEMSVPKRTDVHDYAGCRNRLM